MTSTGGIDLDPWRGHYAVRASGLSASEVRSLFSVANRKEVVSLAGGMPFVRALPTSALVDTAERVIRTHGPEALQYGSGQGDVGLRETILEVMALEGISARADDVVVTTGSQQGLDLIAKLFINPGDVVLTESPSYVGALGVFRSYEANVHHVAMDDEGMIPDALREAISSIHAEGKTIKLLYVIPNFHNPAGVTLSAARRAEILDIAQAHNILLIEDNPYGLIWFDAPAPAPIRSADDEGVVYLGSFSKTFAPGLRVGWVVAPHGIREKLILASEAAILSPSVFTQLIIRDYFTEEDWRGQINEFRGLYQTRRDTMIDALATELPGLHHTTPGGGFFLWATLPEGLDSKEMLPRAITELVAYTPGTAFFANHEGRGHLRLAFCYPEPARIREGIVRLARVIRDEVDIINTFGPSRHTTDIDQHVDSPPPNLG
jgi:DNA-binding transcriptional MocR family regulator